MISQTIGRKLNACAVSVLLLFLKKFMTAIYLVQLQCLLVEVKCNIPSTAMQT